MGRLGSTTSPRARQPRRVLARWQRDGLTLREFGQQRGIPLSMLTWWRGVFKLSEHLPTEIIFERELLVCRL
ncbi:MAG: hypothetical protein H6Q33_3876 [Deltaproteobacteria bacterium]|nr:hypothetical protein [Deltaproteobacteria bacterium]